MVLRIRKSFSRLNKIKLRCDHSVNDIKQVLQIQLIFCLSYRLKFFRVDVCLLY